MCFLKQIVCEHHLKDIIFFLFEGTKYNLKIQNFEPFKKIFLFHFVQCSNILFSIDVLDFFNAVSAISFLFPHLSHHIRSPVQILKARQK